MLLVLVIEQPKPVNRFRKPSLERREMKFRRHRQVPLVVDRVDEAQVFEEDRPLDGTVGKAGEEDDRTDHCDLHCQISSMV